MELNFQKVQNKWVAEFQLDAAAAIHIEGVAEGDISIYQRSGDSSKYAFVKDTRTTPTCGTVIDYDLSALIYPKFIKVVCLTEPTYAAIISDGEVTEIKSQSKEVEIVSNGTTEITPDAGYSYLSGVSVKVNVPQSGEGGGGGGGSASSVEYFNVKQFDEDTRLYLLMSSYLVKAGLVSPIAFILGEADLDTLLSLVEAVAIMPNLVIEDNYFKGTIREKLINLDVDYDSLPRLTEEEFYNLNA